MDVFAALADPVRRDLLVAVAAGPVRVADLAARHAVSRPAVSRHLRVLGESGLVVGEDRGRERHYRLRPGGLEPVAAFVTGLAAVPPVAERHLDALDLEVRRTVRERGPGRREETG
ncbi:hypothetical protein GCM10009737_19150 [Nocardioides lentus]|uniref:HTH arsR-type domain-containing protein n=1 Tax=Nocardioides lentus TaxID=338077 RepID=A0ABN2PC15_9ACTN